MSKIALSGNASGTGVFTFASPNSNTDRTLDIPDASGVIDRLNRAGNVLQVVSTSSSTVVTNTSGTSSLLSASITPSSASNKILILTSLPVGITANTNALAGSVIYRGTTSGTQLQVLYTGNFSTPGCYGSLSHTFLDSPSTTSSQTYTLGMLRASGNTTSVATENVYSLTLMEIAA